MKSIKILRERIRFVEFWAVFGLSLSELYVIFRLVFLTELMLTRADKLFLFFLKRMEKLSSIRFFE